MAATADPRAKGPATQPRHLKSWAPPPPPPRGHRAPSLPAVSGTAAGASRDRRRASTSHRRGGAQAVDDEPYDGRLEDLRARLMGHLHDAADRLRLPPAKTQPPPEPENPPPPPPPEDGAAAVAASMPWTLRERRRRPSARGSTTASPTTPWSTATSQDDGVRTPFAVALEAEEIEEDVYALTGARPRRRPRKRPRTVQRQLDSLFPGLWLTEITADAYRVPDG